MTIVHFENIRRLSLVFFGLLSKLKTRSSHVSICAFHCGPAGREVEIHFLTEARHLWVMCCTHIALPDVNTFQKHVVRWVSWLHHLEGGSGWRTSGLAPRDQENRRWYRNHLWLAAQLGDPGFHLWSLQRPLHAPSWNLSTPHLTWTTIYRQVFDRLACRRRTFHHPPPLDPVGPAWRFHHPLSSRHLWLGQNLLRLHDARSRYFHFGHPTAEPNLPLYTAADTICDLLSDASDPVRAQYARLLAQNIPVSTPIDYGQEDRANLFQENSPLRCVLITQGGLLRQLCHSYSHLSAFIKKVRLAFNESQQGGKAGFTVIGANLPCSCWQCLTGDQEQTKAGTGGEKLQEALVDQLAHKAIGFLGGSKPHLPSSMLFSLFKALRTAQVSNLPSDRDSPFDLLQYLCDSSLPLSCLPATVWEAEGMVPTAGVTLHLILPHSLRCPVDTYFTQVAMHYPHLQHSSVSTPWPNGDQTPRRPSRFILPLLRVPSSPLVSPLVTGEQQTRSRWRHNYH